MKLKSFFKQGFELVPVEVEVTLLPGIPQMHLLGRADQSLRESQLRIKSAIKKQGFRWPTTKQIIVNLKPSTLPKSSEGLELAIAVAYLCCSGQIELPFTGDFFVYGSLSLLGEVSVPVDLELLDANEQKLLTGSTKQKLSIPTWQVQQLSDLKEQIIFVEKSKETTFDKKIIESEVPDFYLSEKVARLMMITAVGEHSLLLAGSQGSGKSTFANYFPFVLPPAGEKEIREHKKWTHYLNHQQVHSRPVVNPHHSIPNISMIGGGVPLVPGEITRAHGGVLILDEFLEYSSEVKESLREPLEKGEITVARKGQMAKFSARFQLLATTNLCCCGELCPGKFNDCRFSIRKCRSYLERLSGPLADRFACLSYTSDWGRAKDIALKDIRVKVQNSRNFAENTRAQIKLNSSLEITQLEQQIETQTFKCLMPSILGSQRRYKSVLQVARSIADLEQSKFVHSKHIEEALEYSYLPFRKLRDIFN